MVARQIALNLEREERTKERELQERMRHQLRLDDEAAQLEAQMEIQRRIQEEKDQVSPQKFTNWSAFPYLHLKHILSLSRLLCRESHWSYLSCTS